MSYKPRLKCELCSRSNAIIVERTNPLNYHVQRIRLCSHCRNKMGISVPGGTLTTSKYRMPSKEV